jgi:malonyl-CoA decarboxylase
MGPAEKEQFFLMLEKSYGPDPEAILKASDRYKKTPDLDALMALTDAIEPARQELFRRINMAPNGTATIVGMREDLLSLLPERPSLKAVDVDIEHLLASWFNRGFLRIEQIHWDSSAALLQKIMAYESVHPMAGWDDLKRRLAEDRRFFAFFHPALPDEPLIFVEVALVRGMSSAVQPLLAERDDPLDAADADTAIFYAINNCQVGLIGISFGNFLIKQVVVELARELPGLKTFSTLSPIPGFRKWLASHMQDERDTLSTEEARAFDQLQLADWYSNKHLAQSMEAPLKRLCARYLLQAKVRGRPADAVARFHLRNGARLERINWLGDISAKGITESAGMLVNYLYDPKTIERNHENYIKNGKIAASTEVGRLAK